MNTARLPQASNEPRGRWICRIVRPWCAAFGHERSRHVTSCAACRAYFQAGTALERALHRDAQDLVRTTSVPDDFERRLLQAVRSSRAEAAAPGRNRGYGNWTYAGIGVAAAMAVMAIFLSRPAGLSDPRDLTEATAARDAAVIVDAVESFSTQLVGSVIPAAGAMVAANPLQEEIGSVYSDMRSALDFLALNFLPSGARRSPPPPTRTI